VVFTAGSVVERDTIAENAFDYFAPVFESAILELWGNKFAGRYKSDTAVMDIYVNSTSATIQVTLFQAGDVNLIAPGSSNLGAYLWPGIDENTFR
jgi:hypothetical protein